MPMYLLTDKHVRNAKPKEKAYRLADGNNLYLLVSPTGTRSWQLRYTLDGKPQTATLGKYPSVTLEAARKEADEKRKLANAGVHVTTAKRVDRALQSAARAQTFRSVAVRWAAAEARRKAWSDAYIEEVEQSLRNHLSALNDLPVSSIIAAITSPILHAVEISAPAMEEKVSRRLNAIMDYAVEIGALVQNPLPRRRRSKKDRKHFPAVTELPAIGEILRAARAADPCKGIQRAHILLVFTAQRVSEVVGARWEEFALDGVAPALGASIGARVEPAIANWTIPRARMKKKDHDRGPHTVPLPPHLIDLLRQWREEDRGVTEFVCPAPRDPKRSITPEACEKFYRDVLNLAGRHSPHSWRSAFSTVCRDKGKDADAVESQLDHVVGNKVASAYDRAQRIEIRRELIAWYAETLIAARDGATVAQLRGHVSPV